MLENGTGTVSAIIVFAISYSLMMEEEKRYVDKTYWDNRYASKMESFEWYFLVLYMIVRVIGYESLKAFDIDRFIKKDDSILFPGCGNSCIKSANN